MSCSMSCSARFACAVVALAVVAGACTPTEADSVGDTAPVTQAPVTTAPATTVASTAAPATTAPATTAPATTVAATTAPVTTAPVTTVPSSTTEPSGDASAEDISLDSSALTLTEFHDTANLPADLADAGALSAIVADWSAVISVFAAMLLVADADGSGDPSDGDSLVFVPQPVVAGNPVPLPIDSYGPYFVGGSAEWSSVPDEVLGSPLTGVTELPDGSWVFDGAGGPVVFARESGTGEVSVWIVDGSPELTPTP